MFTRFPHNLFYRPAKDPGNFGIREMSSFLHSVAQDGSCSFIHSQSMRSQYQFLEEDKQKREGIEQKWTNRKWVTQSFLPFHMPFPIKS